MREAKGAMKYTQDLPKFRDVLQMKGTRLKNLGASGPSTVDMAWDLSEQAKKDQVFRLGFDHKGQRTQVYLSKQELEHYLRAV